MADKSRAVYDENGVRYMVREELGRGGQGATFKTQDPGVIIKISFVGANDEKKRSEYRDLIDEVRCLPLTRDMHIAFPVYVLRGCCGYVMQLMNDMESINEQLLEMNEANTVSEKLEYYQRTGGLLRRLKLLINLAEILDLLRGKNLVYADLSPANVFVSKDITQAEVWLIDADNIRYSKDISSSFGTPEFWAPEVACGQKNSMFADVYSFALLAYILLTSQKPFYGNIIFKNKRYDEDERIVSDAQEDDWGVDGQGNELMEDDWDVDEHGNEPAEGDWGENSSDDVYAMAEKGLIPWIDDPDNRDNECTEKFIRPYTIDEGLFECFNRTFNRTGRKEPESRPTPKDWIKAIHNAINNVVECGCGWTYYASESVCPKCDAKRPECCKATVTEYVFETTDEGTRPLYHSEKASAVIADGKTAEISVSDIRPFPGSYAPSKDYPAFSVTFSNGMLDIMQRADFPCMVSVGDKKYKGGGVTVYKALEPQKTRISVPSLGGVGRARVITFSVI